jgi:hypothetical protein
MLYTVVQGCSVSCGARRLSPPPSPEVIIPMRVSVLDPTTLNLMPTFKGLTFKMVQGMRAGQAFVIATCNISQI